MLSDLKFALRSLRKSPGFAAVAIPFACTGDRRQHRYLQPRQRGPAQGAAGARPGAARPLQLVRAPGVGPQSINGWTDLDPVTKETTCTSFSLATFEAFRTGTPTLSDVFAFSPLDQLNVIIAGQAQVVRDAQVVSGNFSTAVGAPMAAGRPHAGRGPPPPRRRSR